METAFLLTINLLSRMQDITWTKAFCPAIWVVIFVWLIGRHIAATKRRGNGTLCLATFSSIFEGVLRFFFTETVLFNCITSVNAPFESLDTASVYVKTHKDSFLVQNRSPSGSIKPGTFHSKLKITQTNEELVQMIVQNRQYFSFEDLEQAWDLKKMDFNNLAIVPAPGRMEYAVGFCRPEFKFKERATFLWVSEAGLRSFHDTNAVKRFSKEKHYANTFDQPDPISLRSVHSSFGH